MSFKFPNELEDLRAMEIAELLLNNVKAKELHSCCIDISDIKRKGEKGDSYIIGIHFEHDRDKLINTILMLLESLKIKTPSEFVKVVEVHR